MQNIPEKEIDLMRLLHAMWQKMWVIVLSAAVLGAAAFAYTRFFVTPMYRTSVSIYVDNRTAAEMESDYISSSSLSTAQRLVKTYVTIIESDTVLQKVVEAGQLSMSAAAVREMMSAGAVNETEVFRIYITHSDPELAAHIANTVADVAPGQISEFISGSSTRIIDYAKVPTAPSSPNYQRNTALGAVIGAVVAAAIICLTAILDVRIEDGEELERLFELPVLGAIPAFDSTPKSGGKYAYGYDSKKGAKS